MPDRSLMRFVVLLLLCACIAPARAQVTDAASRRTPRFFYLSSPKAIPVEFSAAPMLRRPVTVALEQVTLADALAQIGEQTGVRFAYSAQLARTSRRVSLSAQRLALAAALTQVLLDTGLDVVFSPSGEATLTLRGNDRGVVELAGSVEGRITDARTGTGIAGATVQVDGRPWRAVSDQAGKYRIAGVDAGSYLVLVRRLGFRSAQERITVTGDGVLTLNFALAPAPTSLKEVVTTATGERSRLEVGNSIGTIKADSIVPTTLIRNMSDLLTARTPGVVVSNTSGLVGAPSKIRIRGINSISLNNDPIVVIDGVRVYARTTFSSAELEAGEAASPIGGYAVQRASFGGSASQQRVAVAPSRLDDIDPNIIESIDVLRGPSASSLYGTEAANGVIVIKTKKGQVGSWRGDVSGGQGWSYLPGGMPLKYYGWGRIVSGEEFTSCVLFHPTSTRNVADGTCAQDSVTAFNPMNDPQMRTIGTGRRQTVSANLSGGTEQLRTFLALSHANAVGMSQMSAVEQRRVANTWGAPAPAWMRRPNAEQQISGSSRTNLRTSSQLDVALSVTGTWRHGLLGGTGLRGLADRALGSWDTLRFLPAEVQRVKQTSLAKRGGVSLQANYVPASWMTLTGTLGGDYTLRTDESLLRTDWCDQVINLNDGTTCESGRSNMRGETFVTSASVNLELRFSLTRALTSRTSLGEQFAKTKMYGLSASNGFGTSLAFGTDLLSPSPVTTTSGSQLFEVMEDRNETATAGIYLQQTFAFRERLFLTGGIRQDVASAFGSAVIRDDPPLYPKFDASWLVSDESFFPNHWSISNLRLRVAYGHSGTQALRRNVLNRYARGTGSVDGTPAVTIVMASIGNALLRPERGTELEGGFDAAFFPGARVRVEATMYRKLSKDAIMSMTLPRSFGAPERSQQANVGSVENRGVELSLSGRIVETRALGWDVTVNLARNTNRLVHKDTAVSAFGNTEFREGYPVNAYFGYPVESYQDTDGNGILSFREVVFGNDKVFYGATYPRSEVTYLTTVLLFGSRVRLSANINQRNGLANRIALSEGDLVGGTYARAWVDRTRPLTEQAGAMAALVNGAYFGETTSLRLGELSLALTVPPRWVHRLGQVRTASLIVAGRNLAFWSNYVGKDPNVNSIGTGGTQPGIGDSSLDSGGTIPQPREWTVRFNLGL